MAKTISFTIKLEGSKQVLSEIDKIGKALTDKLKSANIKVDDKAFDEIQKSTEGLKKNVRDAGNNITELTKRLRQLRGEGKENTFEYKELTDQVGQLKVEQQQTNDAIKRSQAALKAQADLQKLLNNEIKATDLTQKQFFQALNSGLDEADPKYQDLVQSFVRLKQEEKEFRDGLRVQQRILSQSDEGVGRYRRLNAELVNARAALKDLTDEELQSGVISQSLRTQYGLTANTVEELTRRISQLDTELKETDASIGNYQRNVGNYESALNNLDDILQNVGGSFGGPISGIGQFANGLRGLATAGGIGAAIAALGELVSAGKEALDLADEFIKREGEIQNLTSLQGEQLQEFTVRVTAIAQVEDFQVDETELARAANTIANQLTDGDFDRALDLVQTGLQGGLNISGDFLDRLTEYAPQFREAGKSAEELLETINIEIKSGVFSDKGVDSIKEATERIGRLEQAALEGLDQLGISSAEIQQQLESGAISVDDVIRQASEAISQLPENSTVARQAIEKIFGTPGVDAGRRFIEQLQEVDGNIEEVADETTRLFQIQQQQIEAQENLGNATAELAEEIGGTGSSLQAIGTNIQAFFIRRLVDLINFIQPAIDLVKEIGGAFDELVSAILPASEEGNRFRDVVRLLNPALNVLKAVITGLAESVRAIRIALRDFFTETRVGQGIVSGLRVAIQGIRDSFDALSQNIQNIPALFSGITAAARQTATNIARFFQSIALGAQQLQTRLQLAVTFDDEKEADLRRQIEALRQQREQFEAEGRTIGEAFTEAYTASLEQRKELAINARLSREAQAEQEKQASTAGEKVGQSFGDGVAKGISDSEKKAIEARNKALENIRSLETGLIENEFDASQIEATTQAEADISGLVGDPAQIQRQAALIKAQLALSLGEIEQSRVQAFSETIGLAKQAAANEIALLTGSPNEIQQQSFIIRQSLVTQIEGIVSDRENAINDAIADLQARRDSEIAALTGSPEEIDANSLAIRETYARAIKDLGETRKRVTQSTELEVINLRRQIQNEFGGDIAEDLQNASLVELQIARDRVNQRLAILEQELERQQEVLRQKALLKQQQLQIDLQAGVTPERAQQIADELLRVEEDLNKDILEAKKNNAQQRLDVVKAIVPESIALSNQLAQAEIDIDKAKNDKILEQNKARIEQQKQLEKEITEALTNAGFEIAGAAVDAFIQSEQQRLDLLTERQKRSAEASANAQKDSTRIFYEQQIAEAEGNAERQEELRNELANKLIEIDRQQQARAERIDRNAAREQQKIAIKQALLNGALSATKTLAQTGFTPAAIPLLIALAAQIAGQIATIKAQRFEEGGKLVKGIENYIVKTYEAGHLFNAPDINAASGSIPNEGVIKGPSHAAGGVTATFNNSAIEVEGGEYKLRNGKETYIINKKSTRIFKPELDSLKGNTTRFNVEKREIASRINNYKGFGVKFNQGGLLGLDRRTAIQPPVALQNLSNGSVTRQELLRATDAIYEGIRNVSISIDNKTDVIAEDMQNSVAAINGRIDRLKVYADTRELVGRGNELIQAQSKAEL